MKPGLTSQVQIFIDGLTEQDIEILEQIKGGVLNGNLR